MIGVNASTFPGEVPITQPGRSLARYVCLQRLARGGMAELHLARREGPADFRKLVALKRLLPHLADEPAFARMFITEARLAARLDHPNIAQVIDFGELEERSFLAMEYVHGRDVRAVLQAAGRALPGQRVPLACALALVDEVAAGLHHAHELRGPGGQPLDLVHRDISPSNVLVGYDGRVKLTDFGIAKATAEAQATATHSLKGKISYMSPEQARGEPVDRRSDVFSLGIVLFELTTGCRLFAGASEFAILNQVARGELIAPREVVPDYPPALERVVLRALAPVVDARYPTARQFADDLRAAAAAVGGRADREALGAMMGELFGAPPYPDLDAAPSAGAMIDLGPATRSRFVEDEDPTVAWAPTARRRKVAPLALAALTMVLGLGLGATLSGGIGSGEAGAQPQAETRTTRSEDEPADPESAGSPSTRGASPAMAAGVDPTSAATQAQEAESQEGSEPASVMTVEGEPPEDKSTRGSGRTAPRRRSGHRARPRPRAPDKADKATKTKGLDRWLPPSQR